MGRHDSWRALILAAAFTAGSCREGPIPFESTDRDDRDFGEAVQLTFNAGDDQMPSWSVDGDSIYYTTERLTGIPNNSNGVLIALPVQSGPAQVLLPELQANVPLQAWLTSPVISPDGKFIAFIDLYQPTMPPSCTVACAGPNPNIWQTIAGFPELDSLRIRLFSTSTRTVVDEVKVLFYDRVFDTTRPGSGLTGTWVFDMHPYQARWAVERTAVFRPSWSPDGTRLVFSDGAKLLVWTIGQNAPEPIPNTVDAMLPAWSPNGQTIAYSRAERGLVLRLLCTCNTKTGVQELQDRIMYRSSLDDGTLTLINPDGSNKREIGRGDGPAWTPDGQLVFRRLFSLSVSAADGTNVRAIPGTTDAYVPSVSPDGRLVAFSRDNGEGNAFNIWVAPLSTGQ